MGLDYGGVGIIIDVISCVSRKPENMRVPDEPGQKKSVPLEEEK